MKFKNGALGIVVVMVSLALALMGSWALSVDVNDVTVTKYNYLADVTGLFESSTTPEYIEYNPSTNYTGYYTDNSVINGTAYFDGVNYEQSVRANQYRLNLAPLSNSSGTFDLTDTTASAVSNINAVYYDYNAATSEVVTHANNLGTTIMVSDLIADLDPDSDYNRIIIKSTSDLTDLSDTAGSPVSVQWCLFSTTSNLYVTGAQKWLYFASDSAYNKLTLVPPIHPALSIIIDMNNSQVTMFSDKDCQNQLGIYNLSDIMLTYGGTLSNNYIVFGDEVDYELYELQSPAYMDPSKGVELS